jgi:hypothetical protein
MIKVVEKIMRVIASITIYWRDKRLIELDQGES